MRYLILSYLTLLSLTAIASNPATLLIKCPVDVNDQNDYLNFTNDQTYKIRLKMNRVDNANFNEIQAQILFDEINAAFSDLNISFYWDCIVYDTDHTQNSRNAIDINISPGITGDTPQMPGTEVEIGDLRDNAVIIHELGHALGLLHTHHSDNHFNTNPGSETCEEYVNPLVGEENNGYTCGDCIKSTLATTDLPRMQISYDSANNTCTYTPLVGSNGEVVFQARDSRMDIYDPVIGNFMSYDRSFNGSSSTINDIDCRSTFVAEQGNRMRNIIEGSPYLNEVRIYDNFSDVDFMNNSFSDGINFGGNIYIDQEVLLPDGAEIAMFGNHKIVITQQGSIKGNDILIHSPCDEEWKGIEVYGETNQNINKGIHLTGSSIIKNAKTGISQAYGGANGYMNLAGTTFLDCNRGIELMKSDNDQSIIENCQFINGIYGITAWMNDFTATSCTFNNIDERGIYGLASSPTINNDNDLVGPHFFDCNIGILLAFPSGQSKPAFISDNFFLDNRRGIAIVSGAGVDISARTVVTNNRFDNNFMGFRVSGASAYTLRNNDFYNGTFGNYIFAAGGEVNDIALNNYNGAITGSNFLVDNNITTVEQNCYDNHTFSDINVNGVFTDQGTPDLANGNCFSLTNPEIRANNNGPGFTYFQLETNSPNLDQCMLVNSNGNFTILDSDNTDLPNDCGTFSFTGTSILSTEKSPCNPNNNESDVNDANDDLIDLMEEIENNEFLDQATKDDLLEYYERCLKKNKLLLVEILRTSGRVTDAVYLLRNEIAFDMRIKGYSLLVQENRLTEAHTYLINLIISSSEQQEYVFGQHLYLNSLVDSTYTPRVSDLLQLFNNGQDNTVLSGFSRSVYLYFTDSLIEVPITLDGQVYSDPRSIKMEKLKTTIYPNPITNGSFTISRTVDTNAKYELFTSDGIAFDAGYLSEKESMIYISSNYNGLLLIRIVDINGFSEIHKLLKTQ